MEAKTSTKYTDILDADRLVTELISKYYDTEPDGRLEKRGWRSVQPGISLSKFLGEPPKKTYKIMLNEVCEVHSFGKTYDSSLDIIDILVETEGSIENNDYIERIELYIERPFKLTIHNTEVTEVPICRREVLCYKDSGEYVYSVKDLVRCVGIGWKEADLKNILPTEWFFSNTVTIKNDGSVEIQAL